MVMMATCCWCMGQGLGEVWGPLFSKAMGPGVGGQGGSMGTGCGSSMFSVGLVDKRVLIGPF